MNRRRARASGSITLAFLVGALLAGCTGTPAADPDFVMPQSQREASERLMTCMNEKGWASYVANDGSLEESVPEEQRDANRRDLLACYEEHVNPNGDRLLTRDELIDRYDKQLESVECLEALGYDIEDPPTLQSYLDEQGAWRPWNTIYDSVDYDTLEYVRSQCNDWW